MKCVGFASVREMEALFRVSILLSLSSLLHLQTMNSLESPLHIILTPLCSGGSEVLPHPSRHGTGVSFVLRNNIIHGPGSGMSFCREI
jgi:hypothetical protein